EINANMVIMAQIEKVLFDSEASSSSADEKISEIADQQVLFDKMIVQMVELDKHVRDLKNMVLGKDFKISELEECVRIKDLEIEKCLERLNVCENKLHKIGQTNQTVYMIMPSKDNLYNGRKGIGFENPGYFEKAKDLRPTLYDEKVISLGNLNASYVNEKINFEDDYFQEIINPDFEKIDSSFQQTSSLKPYVPNVIFEKIIIDLDDKVVNLLEKEKANLETIESLKSKSFESSENVSSESENQSENDCPVVEKECDKKENSKVIAPGRFKFNVSQCVSPISMSKSSCDSKNVEIKLKRKRRKRKSSKQNVKQVDNDVSRTNHDFVHFLDLDTFSSVRRHKNSGVIWKKKGSSNTSNSANKKQEFVKSYDKKVEKQADEKKRDMSRVKCYNCKKEGHFAKDCKKAKNRVEKENQQSKDFENQNKDLQDKYDVLKNQKTTFEMNNKELNEQLKELIEKNNDLLAQTKLLKEQLQVKHVVIDTHAECQEKYAKLEAERYEYMIRNSAYFDNDKQHRMQIADQKVLFDKMSVQMVELAKHVRDLKNTVLEKDFKISELEECVRNKDLEIKKCLERLNVCENKLHKIGQTNQTVHMIMPSKDNLYNGRK
nr:hypothetical protein [Tanacetum cinerariifolium]